MRDDDKQTVKIELLSQWKLEAEFRNSFQPHFRANSPQSKPLPLVPARSGFELGAKHS